MEGIDKVQGKRKKTRPPRGIGARISHSMLLGERVVL